jgi:hypothetical protein
MADLDFQSNMVNREDEFVELRGYLDKASNEEGNTIFISGEAGVGKSRLLSELIDFAHSKGVQILQGWSLYESLTPYMPFIEALRSADLDYLFSREDPPKVECVYLISNTGLLIKDVLRKETELDFNIFAYSW